LWLFGAVVSVIVVTGMLQNATFRRVVRVFCPD